MLIKNQTTYINSSQEINDEDPKFKIGDIVRTSKYKKKFAESFVPNWFKDVFAIKNVKDTCPKHILLVTLKVKKCWNVLRKRIAKNKSKGV